MFGGTIWAGGIGGIEDHTDKERNPPARPIELEFPKYKPPFNPRKLNGAASSAARDQICRVRSFAELRDEDVSNFNIKFEHDIEISKLLPSQFQERPLLFDDDLEAMLVEISIPNRDAFREILRMEPLPGRTKPRLAYARNFFGSLEDMARYWDTSLDHYYSVPLDKEEGIAQKASTLPTVEKPSTQNPSSTTTNDTNPDVVMTDDESVPSKSDGVGLRLVPPGSREVYKGYRFGSGDQVNPGTRVAMVRNFLKMVMHKFMCRDHEPIPAPREKLVIRGVKIQSIQYQFCIARIPKDTKLARARMVEGPLMAAHCREETRFQQSPRVASAESVLGPSVAKATVSAASKPVNGKASTSGSHFVGEKFDLFREIGCMLILATQRQREGKDKNVFSGTDKWWVACQRWGGGPLKWGQLASESYEDEDPSWSPEEKRLQAEKLQRELEDRNRIKDCKTSMTGSGIGIEDLMANNAPTIPPIPGDPLTGPRKKKLRSLDRPPGREEEMRDGRRLMYVPTFKKKWYQDWQRLRPNTPMWDDKVIYKHIGRTTGASFDDVFMITSVNHHIALLKMRVHPDYLCWLETGAEVSGEEAELGFRKDVLYVQRSTWYDLFNVEARRELLISLWKVMCWLNRDHIDQSEYGKLERKG